MCVCVCVCVCVCIEARQRGQEHLCEGDFLDSTYDLLFGDPAPSNLDEDGHQV
jgi:hypothetical protein